MTAVSPPGAAVIGTGFIGTLHVETLRRLGVPVHGVLGSSPARGAARAAEIGVGHAYATLDDLLADERVQVVHVTSPNHAHFEQVRAILQAGRHVICEKPLAMDSVQSAEMVRLARASGRIAAVCYNIRFYPLNQQARGMVEAGELGEVRFVTGRYHQDWLARPTDWNWRLESGLGGALRSVGDIGTHWIDLTSFITGLRVSSVLAELVTFLPERRRPAGPVETFAAGAGAGETVAIDTDDRGDDPAPLRKWRQGGDVDQPGQSGQQELPALGHRRGDGFRGLGQRTPGPFVPRPPGGGQPGADARLHPDECARHRSGQPAAGTCRGVCRQLLLLLPRGLCGYCRRGAARGQCLGQFRGRSLRDAVLRRRAPVRTRGRLGRRRRGARRRGSGRSVMRVLP